MTDHIRIFEIRILIFHFETDFSDIEPCFIDENYLSFSIISREEKDRLRYFLSEIIIFKA